MRCRPGSPWMPMPISISSSAKSNDGLPTCGTVQAVSAMPIDRTLALTFSVFCVALSGFLLPRLKGMIVAIQWSRRMHGFGAATAEA